MKFVSIAVLCAAALAARPLAAAAQAQPAAPEKAAICSACHGVDGKPVDPSIPVIWGQNEGYIYLELRDFKLGNRKSPIMGQVALGLEKPDMLALAAYFSAKQWPDLGQKSAPADVVHHAEMIDSSAVCRSCHLDHWQGNSTTPRLAGQSMTYLRTTMQQFRSGERANNPWMVALLKTYTDADIDALAQYLAGY